MVSSSAWRAEEWHVGARAVTQWLLLERICNQTHTWLSASHFRNKILHTQKLCEYQFLYALEQKNTQKPQFSFEDFDLNPLGKAGLFPSWSGGASRVGGSSWVHTPGAPSPPPQWTETRTAHPTLPVNLQIKAQHWSCLNTSAKRPQLVQNTESPWVSLPTFWETTLQLLLLKPYCHIILQISTFAQALSLNTDETTACNVFEAFQSCKAASPFILVKLRTAVMTSGKPQCNEIKIKQQVRFKKEKREWQRKKKKKDTSKTSNYCTALFFYLKRTKKTYIQAHAY